MAGKKLSAKGKVVLIGLAAVVAIIIAVSSGSSGASAKITHKIVNVSALDAQHVRVWVTWTNVGKASGSASCVMQVTAHNAYGDEIGSGNDTTGPNSSLAPGQTSNQYQDIVVTNNNAAGVTSTRDVQIVDC